MQLTIEVPNHVGKQLLPYQNQLPELLMRGVRLLTQQDAIKNAAPTLVYNENELLALLVSQPQPQTIINLQPAPALQAKIDDLLWLGKQGTLDSDGESQLERIMWLEHMVRLAKAHASKQLEHTE